MKTNKKGCLFGIVILMLLPALLQGCRTNKVVERTDTSASLRTETIEKIVIDTVMVTVEVPAEAKERETRDTTSYLETSMAKSRASLTWKGGIPYLFHSLENKPQKIRKPVEVASKEKSKIVYLTRTDTKYKEIVVELPWWKKALMWAGAIETVLIIFISLGWWAIGKRRRCRQQQESISF